MKYSLLALAASTALTGVSARHHLGRRHAHPQVDVLPREEECPQTCSTYVTTIVRAKTISGTAPYYGTAPTGIAGTGTAPAGTGVPAPSAGGETTTYTVSPIYASSAPASSEISAGSSVVPAPEESTSCSEYVLTTVYSSVVYSTETSVAWVSSTPEETPAASTPASSMETAPASSAPASSAPVSSAPAASAPASSAPASSAPASSAPASSAPASSAPAASVPASSAPVSSAPVSSAPVSSAPVSSAPASSAPASSVPASSAVSSEVSPASSIATPMSTSPATSVKPLPTPLVTTCSTTGVYTIPARTVTITSTETTIIPKTVTLTRGVNTYGGSTTSVPSATTLTVPIATVATTEGTTTSYITQTTYFCPVAGSYTIGASTSTVTETDTVVTCPGVTAYTPGTYTQTELTTTITKTNEVITCPFEGTETTLTAGASSVPTSVPASTTAVATSAVSSTASSVVPSSSSSVVPSSSVIASSSAPSSSSTTLLATASSSASKTSSAVASPSASKGLDTSGLWSIAYSPYDNNGACKAQSDITSDIADIAKRGFKNVRLYSTDCSGLDFVGSACENNGMGLIAGIFLKEGGVSTGDAQLEDLLKWGKWDLVELLVVGNECVYNNYCTAGDLADYISSTAKKVAGAGYTGKVTTTEPVNIVQENADVLCPVMDVVGVNVQPYFDGAHTAEEAGTFAKSQLGLATTACGGSKSGVILEIGWPTKGSPHGVAVASPENQKTALSAVEKELPGQCNYFTYRNDEWKEPGDFGVETNFGCADTFAIGGSASVSVGGISASVSAGVSY